jgi:hypothetical protein
MVERQAELVQLKIRLRADMKRQIEKLSILADRSLNQQIVLMLEAALLAERAGVGGPDGVIKAIQAKAETNAIEQLSQRLLKLEGRQ